jgi:excisionase family DNA binding protein
VDRDETAADIATEDGGVSGDDGGDLPVVLTVDEVAAIMRVDRKTIYGVIARGEMPGVRRLGRSVRLHRDTVLRWLADGQGRAPRSRGSR